MTLEKKVVEKKTPVTKSTSSRNGIIKTAFQFKCNATVKHVIIGSLVGEKMTIKSQIGPILLCDIMKGVVVLFPSEYIIPTSFKYTHHHFGF